MPSARKVDSASHANVSMTVAEMLAGHKEFVAHKHRNQNPQARQAATTAPHTSKQDQDTIDSGVPPAKPSKIDDAGQSTPKYKELSDQQAVKVTPSPPNLTDVTPEVRHAQNVTESPTLGIVSTKAFGAALKKHCTTAVGVQKVGVGVPPPQAPLAAPYVAEAAQEAINSDQLHTIPLEAHRLATKKDIMSKPPGHQAVINPPPQQSQTAEPYVVEPALAVTEPNIPLARPHEADGAAPKPPISKEPGAHQTAAGIPRSPASADASHAIEPAHDSLEPRLLSAMPSDGNEPSLEMPVTIGSDSTLRVHNTEHSLSAIAMSDISKKSYEVNGPKNFSTFDRLDVEIETTRINYNDFATHKAFKTTSTRSGQSTPSAKKGVMPNFCSVQPSVLTQLTSENDSESIAPGHTNASSPTFSETSINDLDFAELDVKRMRAIFVPSNWRSSNVVVPIVAAGFAAAAGGMMAVSLLFLPWVIAPSLFWTSPIVAFFISICFGRSVWRKTPTQNELQELMTKPHAHASFAAGGAVRALQTDAAALAELAARTKPGLSHTEQCGRFLFETKVARGQHASIGAALGAAVASGLAWQGILLPFAAPFVAFGAVVVGAVLVAQALHQKP